RSIFFCGSYSGEQSCLSWPYAARDETVVVERSAGRREDIESEKGVHTFPVYSPFSRARARFRAIQIHCTFTSVRACVRACVCAKREETNKTEKKEMQLRSSIALSSTSKGRAKPLLDDSGNRRIVRHPRQVVPELCLVAEGIIPKFVRRKRAKNKVARRVPTRSSSSRPANKGRAVGDERPHRDPDRVSSCDAGTVRDDDDEKGSDRGEDGRRERVDDDYELERIGGGSSSSSSSSSSSMPPVLGGAAMAVLPVSPQTATQGTPHHHHHHNHHPPHHHHHGSHHHGSHHLLYQPYNLIPAAGTPSSQPGFQHHHHHHHQQQQPPPQQQQQPPPPPQPHHHHHHQSVVQQSGFITGDVGNPATALAL
ncbi:hypothetical protein ALC60_09437, partial [Trachymyrmex zeteki]